MAEGFGGSYVAGSTDLNAGIIVDGPIPASWSLDMVIAKHISW